MSKGKGSIKRETPRRSYLKPGQAWPEPSFNPEVDKAISDLKEADANLLKQNWYRERHGLQPLS